MQTGYRKNHSLTPSHNQSGIGVFKPLLTNLYELLISLTLVFSEYFSNHHLSSPRLHVLGEAANRVQLDLNAAGEMYRTRIKYVKIS